uniref:Uncharacterized protein n=1 Tax=Arundo donax TaxID=35708 RepID=A0A0A9BEH5_ARUDO
MHSSLHEEAHFLLIPITSASNSGKLIG